MCGICCCCGCCFGHVTAEALAAGPLGRRGPDSTHLLTVTPSSSSTPSALHLAASVLHHRGPFTQQPLVSRSGDLVLLWNGEIFGGLPVPPEANDGRCLLAALEAEAGCEEAEAGCEEALFAVVSRLRGPFAFALFHRPSGCLLFGRDVLGRRSLVLGRSSRGHLLLSSVLLPDTSAKCCELPPIGLFRWRLADGDLLLRPWDFAAEQRAELHADFLAQLSLGAPLTSGLVSPPPPSLPALPGEGQLPELASEAQRCAAARLLALLSSAVRRRVEATKDSNLAVLFSGGVDCATVATLASRFAKEGAPIDLLNVAFERPGTAGYEVPDRLTARATLQELRALAPQRPWRLVEIDVPLAELAAQRRSRIAALVRPAASVLDDSLGCALWFAAGGPSTARLLLSGAGADELLAGYSRHRAAFDRRGAAGLEAELQLEIARIGDRNLGRDDRVAGDHGRELRLPFLDEEVVAFLLGAPAELRANLTLARGFGEKLLLRLVAWELGLRGAAVLPKRAMQFGSRIAKAEAKERGDMPCSRLTD